jgi:hypothetical protein
MTRRPYCHGRPLDQQPGERCSICGVVADELDWDFWDPNDPSATTGSPLKKQRPATPTTRLPAQLRDSTIENYS